MELWRMECHNWEQQQQFKRILKHIKNFKQISYKLLVGEFICLQLDVHISVFYRTAVNFFAKTSIFKYFINCLLLNYLSISIT